MRPSDLFPPASGSVPRDVEMPEVDVPEQALTPGSAAAIPQSVVDGLPMIAMGALEVRFPGSLGDDDTGEELTGDF